MGYFTFYILKLLIRYCLFFIVGGGLIDCYKILSTKEKQNLKKFC